jgi:hypothetical protein
LIPNDRMSAASLSDVIGDRPSNTGDDDDDDGGGDDMPADRTRIETNPLEKLKEMENASKPSRLSPDAAPIPSLVRSPQPAHTVHGKGPAKQMPPSGPLPLPAPPSGPQQRSSDQRFPNLSNLPTVITPDPEPDLDAPAYASTVLGAGLVAASHGAPPTQNGAQPQPQPNRPSMPSAYPVMDAAMSEQMMSGNLYPSEPYSRDRAARASQQQPLQHQGPPSDSGSRSAMDSGQQYAQHGASLMSPVGQQYPHPVDWAEAAAMPARALPSWMLAVLFIGAIGVALTITIVIARMLR